MLIGFSCAAVILLALSLLPLWQHPFWVIRAADFARIQLAYLALACLFLQMLLAHSSEPAWILVAVATAASLLWNLGHIAPFTPLWRKEARSAAAIIDPANTLSILTANVLMTNRNATRLLQLVERHSPDIVITLESDRWWQTQLDSLLPAMPYAIKCPLDNLYGMHLYSRLPLQQTEIEYLVEHDVPSIHTQVKLRSGRDVRLHALHPRPPSPTENESASPRDAELIVVARSLADSEAPAVVAGDLNDVPWSRTAVLFRKISAMLDPRVGRGLFNTFHAQLPMLRWPLDHLYHSAHFELVEMHRLRDIGSDHYPLLTSLILAAGDDEETTPPADDGDIAAADAILEAENTRTEDVPAPE